MTSSTNSGEVIGRVIALLIGLAILFYMYLQWGPEFRNLFANEHHAIVTQSDPLPTDGSNPALQACLDKRLGDVNKMQDEGIINADQFGKFSKRAQSLCLAQNPSN